MTFPLSPLAPGETAPDFTLPQSGGGEISLSAQRPHKVVLFFYPRDNTPTCTLEAQDFTRLAEAFRRAGTVVIGISKDSLASHEKFCAKQGIGVTLASDEAGQTCEEYGVWGEKQNYGKTYMGITRSTFLIGPDGRIARTWPKVRQKGHAEEVLEAAEAL